MRNFSKKANDRIVGASLEVFTKKGYHDTTMDDIGKDWGVSKGALYLYFKSKEELYRAILVYSKLDREKSYLLS